MRKYVLEKIVGSERGKRKYPGKGDMFVLPTKKKWNTDHLQVLLSANPEVSHPQALLGSLVSISWKFQFTKIVGDFVINF